MCRGAAQLRSSPVMSGIGATPHCSAEVLDDRQAQSTFAQEGSSANSQRRYTSTDGQRLEMLLRPDSSPISTEQLAAEVKGIYAGLVMVEARCIDIDAAKSEHESPLGAEQWQALIALHRTLLYEHHDFFMATQHPSTTRALQRLALKYSMPVRMWKHGIRAFLELLRHRRPNSQDYMLDFIYLAYQMVALLFETVPSFTDTWIECLGDLTRYRMAIEEEKEKHTNSWSQVAFRWYYKASARHSAIGRLNHHLGVLERPSLCNFALYSKTLFHITPFANATCGLATLCRPIAEDDETIWSSRASTESFVNTFHAILRIGSEDPLELARISARPSSENWSQLLRICHLASLWTLRARTCNASVENMDAVAPIARWNLHGSVARREGEYCCRPLTEDYCNCGLVWNQFCCSPGWFNSANKVNDHLSRIEAGLFPTRTNNHETSCNERGGTASNHTRQPRTALELPYSIEVSLPPRAASGLRKTIRRLTTFYTMLVAGCMTSILPIAFAAAIPAQDAASQTDLSPTETMNFWSNNIVAIALQVIAIGSFIISMVNVFRIWNKGDATQPTKSLDFAICSALVLIALKATPPAETHLQYAISGMWAVAQSNLMAKKCYRITGPRKYLYGSVATGTVAAAVFVLTIEKDGASSFDVLLRKSLPIAALCITIASRVLCFFTRNSKGDWDSPWTSWKAFERLSVP